MVCRESKLANSKMNRNIIFVVWLVCSVNVKGESFNNPVSIAIARYAHMVNSCFNQKTVSSSVSTRESEIAVFSLFGEDYAKMCRPLVEGLGEMYQLQDSGVNSETKILLFSNVTKLPRPDWSQQPSVELDGRYVIYWNGNSFIGHFMKEKSFLNLIRKQQGDVERAVPFTFPVLQEQIKPPHSTLEKPQASHAPQKVVGTSMTTPNTANFESKSSDEDLANKYLIYGILVSSVLAISLFIHLKKN